MFTAGPVTTLKERSGVRVKFDQTLTLTVTDAICDPCNTGWLKATGELVMPYAAEAMAGLDIVLTRTQTRQLAAWAVERALMFELAMRQHRERWFAPASNLEWLYAHRDDPIPPPGSQVYAARLDRPESLPAWSATGSWPDTDVLEDREGYTSSFSIGHLLFAVFGQDFGPDALSIRGQPLARLELPPRYGGYLVPLWPDSDELTVWPPRATLSREDLPGFADWSDVRTARLARKGAPP